MVATAVLRSIDLFRGLTESQLEKIASVCCEETHKAGSVLLREESKAQKLYILLQGKILLKMRVDTAPHLPPSHTTVAVLTDGAPFNWASLIEPHVATLTADCVEQSKVLVIEGTKLMGLMEEAPSMGYQIMKRVAALVASRLRHTRQALVSERESGTL